MEKYNIDEILEQLEPDCIKIYHEHECESSVDEDFRNHACLFNDLPEELQNDRDFVLKAVEVNGAIYEYLSDELKEDEEIAIMALNNYLESFRHLPDELFDNERVVKAAIENDGGAKVLEYVSDRLKEIFEYSKTNVTSTIFICWGAQAALYHFYGIDKYPLEKKLFGIYPHRKAVIHEVLLNGIDDVFYVPQSRHTFNKECDLLNNENLIPLASSKLCGTTILKSKKNNQIFILGHLEYDKDTLRLEYERDLNKGLPIEKPINYFTEDGDIDVKWRSTANILYYNWLNYYVYQITPFKFKDPKVKAKIKK